jgi:ethanolamine ammonia-lyase large subunit
MTHRDGFSLASGLDGVLFGQLHDVVDVNPRLEPQEAVTRTLEVVRRTL